MLQSLPKRTEVAMVAISVLVTSIGISSVGASLVVVNSAAAVLARGTSTVVAVLAGGT